MGVVNQSGRVLQPPHRSHAACASRVCVRAAAWIDPTRLPAKDQRPRSSSGSVCRSAWAGHRHRQGLARNSRDATSKEVRWGSCSGAAAHAPPTVQSTLLPSPWPRPTSVRRRGVGRFNRSGALGRGVRTTADPIVPSASKKFAHAHAPSHHHLPWPSHIPMPTGQARMALPTMGLEEMMGLKPGEVATGVRFGWLVWLGVGPGRGHGRPCVMVDRWRRRGRSIDRDQLQCKTHPLA